jgi:KRAB domain-containing zinc finger protein
MATIHKYGGLDLKPVAEAQMTQVRNTVTFQDVFNDFSREEWALLDDAQKRLYCKMMLENFALVFSKGLAISRAFVATQPWAQRQPQRDLWLDMSLTKALLMGVCPDLSRWCQVDSKDSKQRVLGALKACAETHPCDMCNGVMKELVHLPMKQGIPTGQQSFACKSCGSNFGFAL